MVSTPGRSAGTASGRPGRLTKRTEFLAAARGRRFHTGRMTVQLLGRSRDRPSGGIRVGLTIAKKVGHATERNRLRRRLRQAVKSAALAWPEADVDIVVIARREALAAPFALLVEDLTRAPLGPANGRER